MLNKKFWMLLVVSESEKVKWRRRFICKCDCWNNKIVRMESLNNWNCRSCWCLRRKKTSERMKTHWMSSSRIYNIWAYMLNRCNNIKYSEYRFYWGRWISVCEKWNKFTNFYNDMWSTYKEWLSIDRIDTNGNYCKENCKWSTNIEQANNKRNSNFIEYNGRKQTIAQRSKETWFDIQLRLKRWRTIEEALFTPKRKRCLSCLVDKKRN